MQASYTLGARGPQRQTSSASMNNEFTQHYRRTMTIGKYNVGEQLEFLT